MKTLKNVANSFLFAVILSVAMFVICYVLGMFVMLQPPGDFGLLVLRIISAITFFIAFLAGIANE